MSIQITEQDGEPRISNSGELVYSEKSGTLFIRTNRNGVKPIGASPSITETDPIFSSWLVSSPNISLFTNDVGYLTSFSETDPVFNAWLLATPPLYSFTETDPTVPTNVKSISSNQTDAMDNANAPNAGNPFATIADLGSSGLTLPQVQNIAMFF